MCSTERMWTHCSWRPSLCPCPVGQGRPLEAPSQEGVGRSSEPWTAKSILPIQTSMTGARSWDLALRSSPSWVLRALSRPPWSVEAPSSHVQRCMLRLWCRCPSTWTESIAEFQPNQVFLAAPWWSVQRCNSLPCCICWNASTCKSWWTSRRCALPRSPCLRGCFVCFRGGCTGSSADAFLRAKGWDCRLFYTNLLHGCPRNY